MLSRVNYKVTKLNLHALSRIGAKLWNDSIQENGDSYEDLESVIPKF